jgi:hypothetical protein
MKKGGFDVNGPDLDKNNIVKHTFDTLTEDDHKVLETYCVDLEELFYSRYEVMRQGLVIKDTTPIIILLILLMLLILLKPIRKQVAHRWAALQCQIHQPSDEPLL